jgi:hypothetical protein
MQGSKIKRGFYLSSAKLASGIVQDQPALVSFRLSIDLRDHQKPMGVHSRVPQRGSFRVGIFQGRILTGGCRNIHCPPLNSLIPEDFSSKLEDKTRPKNESLMASYYSVQ